MTDIRVKLEGMDRIQAKLSDPEFVKGPLRDFLSKSAAIIETRGKELAPVDTGRLRASINGQIEELRAVIGPNVNYGAHVEFGTRPHWPPVGALQPWARRHGLSNAFALARAIAKRGTPAQPYMVPALEQKRPEIERMLNEMADAIEQKWER